MPAAEIRTVTVLVTDMAGSTAFRSEFGDEHADRARRAHVEGVRAAVASRAGTLVKGTGDGTLAIFAAAAEALGAAIAIQQRAIAERADQDAPRIRIGLAAGDVTIEEDDCFGRPVIEACRLEADAEPDAILATKLVELLAAGRSEARFVDRGLAELKGFSDPVPVSEVQFEIPRATDVTDDAPVAISPTRLTPPGLPQLLVERPRVDRRLERALRHRIATVEAGAGYGKSTAAASYLLATATPWCWLSCDRGLAQAITLAAHLCAAIAKVYPGFGLDTWPEQPAELAHAFAVQVASSVAEDLTVCVDDVHLLPGEVRSALMSTVEITSGSVHWLLLSREPLQLSPRLALDAGTPLTEADLAFDGPEAKILIETLVPGSDDVATERLHDDTEGWVAGLILSTREGALGHKFVREAPFDYLAEEAVGAMPGDLVDFIERLSLPYRFNADIAIALTGRADAPELIDRLVGGHLFTIPLDRDGVWFRFHHLFRAFLRNRLHGRADVDLSALNCALARAWLDAGELREAVRCFLAAGDERSAARTLGPLFARASFGPSYISLRPLLREISPEVRGQHPDLVVAEATGHFADGRHEEAFEDYERSVELLIDAGEREKASTVLVRYLQSMMPAGTASEQRIAVAERFLPSVGAEGRSGAAAQILAAVAYGHATRFEEAEELIDRALAQDSSAAISALASSVRGYYITFPRGHVDQAMSQIDRGFAVPPLEDPYAVRAIAVGLRSAILPQIGRYEEALAQADEPFGEFPQLFGTAVGFERPARWWRLCALAGIGDWDEAAALAGDANELIAGPLDLWSYRLAGLYGRLAAIRGDVELTRRLMRYGVDVMSRGARTMDGPMVLCDFAHAAADLGLEDLRTSLARDALSYANECGLTYRAAIAEMHCASCTGGDERDGHLGRALALTRDNGYEFLWSRHEQGLAGPLLAHGLTLEPWRDYAAELAASSGRDVARACARAVGPSAKASRPLRRALVRSPDPDPEAIASVSNGGVNLPEVRDVISARPRAPFSLNGFGGLAVSRAGERLPDEALEPGSAHARILARLVAGWPEQVAAEAVMYELWPDQEEGEAHEMLRAALDELGRVLDPWAAQRGRSAVSLGRERLRIVLEPRDRLVFAPLLSPERWESMALKRLKEVEQQTTGPFLPGYASQEWAAEAARRLGRARVDFVIALAERLRAEGQPAAGAERLAALVDREPEREELHRRLMRCYVDAGDPARALRQYHSCRVLLLREHGIEPSAETRALFEALT